MDSSGWRIAIQACAVGSARHIQPISAAVNRPRVDVLLSEEPLEPSPMFGSGGLTRPAPDRPPESLEQPTADREAHR
ncbi:hypothetical protein PVAR5_4580 [Paecilomyces variotii No. 5]|uniref:Uncharacterized protein n=1 Tax=Byssochlamys spectabilis (strain No. 5 / NBRC 109023) TaxID=1356009 RepID=V5G507_BYSSN|nr:hypothetical protein PVAR5_4580 [Paecilomyces variotii No. 5]